MLFSHFHHKYIFLCLLFLGVVFFATPQKAYAADYSAINSGHLCQFSGSTPFSFNGTTGSDLYWDQSVSKNLNIDAIVQDYGFLEYSSFDLTVSLGFSLRGGFSHNINLTGTYFCDIYVNYNDVNGGAQTKLVSNSSIGLNISSTDMSQVNEFTIPCTVPGTPTGARVVLNVPDSFYGIRVTQVSGATGQILDDLDYVFTAIINNFSDSQDSGGGSGGGSSSTSQRLLQSVPVGYSNLNLGVNGDLYFLRTGYNSDPRGYSSIIFKPSYLTPLSFYFPDSISYLTSTGQGGPDNLRLALAMGDYPSVQDSGHAATGSPIAIIGDTRPGDYCFTFGFSNTQPFSRLDTIVNKVQWAVEFNLGWTGSQFALPDNATISYCHFQDVKSGLYYLNIYVFFTTSELFDSFIIRSGPLISPTAGIKESAFSFTKYTGTIQDQINQSQEQWESDIPSHSSFTNAISQTSSVFESVQSIESQAFDRVDQSFSDTGIEDFSLDSVSTQMGTVSGIVNSVYSILPGKLKFIITAVLIIGVLAVIIRAGAYAGGKNGG